MSCPRCGADNQCAMEADPKLATGANPNRADCAGDQSCWCFQVPLTSAQRAMLPASNSCYCAACLEFLVRDINS